MIKDDIMVRERPCRCVKKVLVAKSKFNYIVILSRVYKVLKGQRFIKKTSGTLLIFSSPIKTL